MCLSLVSDCGVHNFRGEGDKMVLIEDQKYCIDYRNGYNVLVFCDEVKYLVHGGKIFFVRLIWKKKNAANHG